ncbi:MAG: serine/threonine protein kinase, partial [Planctomycetaceae bacterium]|nr:serine/threonine protein kinase [Planctomycetaceae bacterium]
MKSQKNSVAPPEPSSEESRKSKQNGIYGSPKRKKNGKKNESIKIVDKDNPETISTTHMILGEERSISEELEQRRVLFEQTWGQPDAPTIEQLLGEVPEAEHPNLLRELLYVEFEFTQRKTAELLLEPYLTRFSEYEAIVLEVADEVSRYSVFQRRSIAGYTLLGELGRGGMGVVYRAKNNMLDSYAAFKIINPKMVDNPETLKRFTRELNMIGRIRHPNIVEAKHADIAPDGSPFLVMELVEGITLSQWSRQNPPPKTLSGLESTLTGKSDITPLSDVFERKSANRKKPEASRIMEACRIIRDAALGLQAIHEAELVHRDIKPGNIMLLPDGR